MPTGLPLSTTNSAVMREALIMLQRGGGQHVGRTVFGFARHDVAGARVEQVRRPCDGASRRR